MLSFLQAKKKLKVLARGEFHSIKYAVTEFSSNELEVKCSVYINKCNWHTEDTWEEALKSIREELNPPKKKPVVIEDVKIIKEVK